MAGSDTETGVCLPQALFDHEAIRTKSYGMKFDKTVVLDKLDELNTNVLPQKLATDLRLIAFAIR